MMIDELEIEDQIKLIDKLDAISKEFDVEILEKMFVDDINTVLKDIVVDDIFHLLGYI